MGETDLISRQAAIDAVNEWLKLYVINRAMSNATSIQDILRQLPSAPPKKVCDAEIRVDIDDLKDYIDKAINAERWIPCSERLPDMHDEVLVTARGEVSIAWLYVDGKWRSNDMPQPMFRDIIAWMPLPEPYKGEQE